MLHALFKIFTWKKFTINVLQHFVLFIDQYVNQL